MSGPLLPILAMVAISVVGLVVYASVSRRRASARRAELSDWALRNAWRSYGESDQGLATRWRGEPFGPGQTVHDLLVREGPEGTSLAFVLRHTSTTYDATNGTQTTVRDRLVVLRMLPVALPWLEMVPEGKGRRFMRALGGASDLRFGDGPFDDAWWVTALDERFARAVIGPDTMGWLMSPAVRGSRLRIEGDAAITWRDGGTGPAAITHSMWLLDGLVHQVPRDAWGVQDQAVES